MSVLTINGFEIPVSEKGVTFDSIRGGESARSVSGLSLNTARYIKRTIAGQALCVETGTAGQDRLGEALRGLIDGLGHGFCFDSTLYSDYKGCGPNSGHNGSVSSSGGKYVNKLSVTNGGTITWPLALGSVWTVSIWRYASSAWHHHVINSASEKWLDGSTSVAATTWLAVSSGSLTLTGSTGVFFDELVAVPYLWPATWPAIVYAQTAAYPKPPFLSVSGTLIPAAQTLTMRGKSGRSQFENAGAGIPAQKFDFTLEED